MVMVMILHLYSAFSTWIYLNALNNTLWGTLPDYFVRCQNVANDDAVENEGQ